MNKYLLQIYDNDQLKSEVSFKSLKAMERQSNIPYHQLRAIFLLSKKKSKFLHPHIQALYEKYKVISCPIDYKINIT
jgi:hypothetical protein